MILDDVVYEVTINVTTKRKLPVTTGKEIAETKSFTFTDFYTEGKLTNVLETLTPTE